MDGWVGGWMGGWVGRWVGGWMDGSCIVLSASLPPGFRDGILCQLLQKVDCLSLSARPVQSCSEDIYTCTQKTRTDSSRDTE